MRYVAFLRGINVGGNKKVPMADLKVCLEKAGFENVKTLLNSGNVAFNAEKVTEGEIEELIGQSFGFSVGVLIRPQDSLKQLVEMDPFKNIKNAKALYVTFLRDKPIDHSPGEFKLLKVEDDAAFWYVEDKDGRGTLDAMSWWDKQFGKNITTRNWNTVVKAANL